MRTEATDNEWKQLYELAARFQEQQPWEWLTPKDLFAVSFFFVFFFASAFSAIYFPNSFLSSVIPVNYHSLLL